MKRWRFWVLIGMFALCFVFVLYNYLNLASTINNPIASKLPKIERGQILDSEGRVLAIQSPIYDLAIWKPDFNVEKLSEDISTLSKIIGIPQANLAKKIEQSTSDYAYIKRRLLSAESDSIKAAKEQGLLSGFNLEETSIRTYPQKEVLSHLIGFAGVDNHGLSGLEYTYDNELYPKDNKKPEADGKVYGNTVVLTINSAIQFEIDKLTRRAVLENNAESAMMVAVSSKTGEIIAYSNAPSYDPNTYYEYQSERFSDWSIQKVYEPGSVFKIFSIASLLELGGIDENWSVLCDGAYEKEVQGKDPISIKCLSPHGVVTPKEIIAYSCNTGAAYASDTVSSTDFYNALTEFGFGERTGVGLPGELPGRFNDPQTWSLRSKPTIAFGQEILVTVMQMISAATVIANDGVLMKPQIVKRVVAHDGSIVYENSPIPIKQVISADNARKVLGFMEAASFHSGSLNLDLVKDIRIAMKTGTAQMYDKNTKKYSESDYIASCLGIFPIENPEIIIYLVIVRPKGDSFFGGKIAAPLVREAADTLSNLLGINRGNVNSYSHSGSIRISNPDSIVVTTTMPNLIGKPKSSLLSLFDRKDLIIHINGEGYVVSQNPLPGTPIKKGDTISLELK